MSKPTLFQQTTELFEFLVPLCDELLQVREAEGKVNVYQQLDKGIRQLTPTISKFRQKMIEKDPDKQTYGPAMLMKMQKLVGDFDHLHEVFEEELKPLFDHFLQSQLKKQQEQEELAKLKEEAIKKAMIQTGRDATKHEEERRQLQRLEQEDRQRKQEEAEAELILLAANAKKEITRRRQQLLDEILSSENELKTVGFKAYCLVGLKRMSSACPTNKEFREALEPVLQFIASIYCDPDLAHLRVVRWLNELFTKSIGRYPGSTNILLATGFKLKNQIEVSDMLREARESLKVHSPAGTLLPPVGLYPNDELYWILEEPNSILKHAEWIRWLERIESVHTLLKTIRDALRIDLDLDPHTAIQQYESQSAALVEREKDVKNNSNRNG